MTSEFRPLAGIRVTSLALNLPGPAALMRCAALGATPLKIEPPAPVGPASGDPMASYSRAAYDALHEGVPTLTIDLKTDAGRSGLDTHLARTDVLLTSFRPSALAKLGLGWDALRTRHPHLHRVRIVGESGAAAEHPGHDLTYLAAHDLVVGTALPPTLYADMAGALLAVQAVLSAALHLRADDAAGRPRRGIEFEVALADAAAWLALPRRWGLTAPPSDSAPGGQVGGAHAGYGVYECADGRVAFAALEPHFARRLAEAAGLRWKDPSTMLDPVSRDAVAAFAAAHDRAALDAFGRERDVPLTTLPPG